MVLPKVKVIDRISWLVCPKFYCIKWHPSLMRNQRTRSSIFTGEVKMMSNMGSKTIQKIASDHALSPIKIDIGRNSC